MVPGNWNQINVIKEEVSKLRRKGGTVSGSTGKLTYRLEGEKLVGQLESFLTLWKGRNNTNIPFTDMPLLDLGKSAFNINYWINLSLLAELT